MRQSSDRVAGTPVGTRREAVISLGFKILGYVCSWAGLVVGLAMDQLEKLLRC